MKYFLMLSFAITQVLSIHAQDIDSVKVLINQGVSLHDNGDYTSAIQKYEKALELDEDNITALGEKALSLLSLKEYKAAIKTCQLAIKKDPQSKSLKFIYVTYANALDALDKPTEAVEIYNQGIELFPYYDPLYYNKGVTLSDLKKYDEALLSFQSSATLNPQHASTQNAIGRILIENNNIPALLAFSRFLIIEPQGERAKSNLPYIQKIMVANVEKTGKNRITINIDPNTLADAEKEGEKENNFSTTDLILSMTAALDYDKKYKKKTEVELFMVKFATVCSSLKEVQKDNYGFYWEYYVPYFIELKEKDLIETFSYLVYASSEKKDVQKWLDKNEVKIELFYEWSSEYEWEKE
jgi:tetratricopeptide (TPR) repeat protein